MEKWLVKHIANKAMQYMNKIDEGYEMDCLISSEFTPTPDYSIAVDFVQQTILELVQGDESFYAVEDDFWCSLEDLYFKRWKGRFTSHPYISLIMAYDAHLHQLEVQRLTMRCYT